MKNREKYVASEAMILDCLRYDGVDLRWKKRSPNSRVTVGDVVGCPNAYGHIVFGIGGNQLFAHCVIWFLVTGKWPEDELDHRDVVHGNNRFYNLRESTRSQNGMNRRPFKSGRGLKGAYTHSSFNGRWQSKIVVDGKPIYLGRFGSEEEAHAAYVAAAKVHHGEFARTE